MFIGTQTQSHTRTHSKIQPTIQLQSIYENLQLTHTEEKQVQKRQQIKTALPFIRAVCMDAESIAANCILRSDMEKRYSNLAMNKTT